MCLSLGLAVNFPFSLPLSVSYRFFYSPNSNEAQENCYLIGSNNVPILLLKADTNLVLVGAEV